MASLSSADRLEAELNSDPGGPPFVMAGPQEQRISGAISAAVRGVNPWPHSNSTVADSANVLLFVSLSSSFPSAQNATQAITGSVINRDAMVLDAQSSLARS